MNKLITEARDKLSQWKIYILRTTSYMGIVNSMLLILVFLQTRDIKISTILVIPFVLGWIVALIFIGYIESEVIKAPQAESRKTLHLNQPQHFIYKKVEEMDEILKRIEPKINRCIKQEAKNE